MSDNYYKRIKMYLYCVFSQHKFNLFINKNLNTDTIYLLSYLNKLYSYKDIIYLNMVDIIIRLNTII